MGTQLSLFEENAPHNDDRPYPLIVADRWGFDLPYIDQPDPLYSIRAWLTGMIDARYSARTILDWRQGKGLLKGYDDGVVTLEEPDKLGRNRTEAYAIAGILYRMVEDITEKTRTGKRDMTRVNEIKDFLAKAGVFADLARRFPSQIAARLQSKYSRDAFTAKLVEVVSNLPQLGVGVATNDVYRGVFHRDAKQLKEQLHTTNPRDKMSIPALNYLSTAEWICSQRLGDAQEVTFDQARSIIKDVAGMIGAQADEVERRMGIDVVTGHRLFGPIDAIQGALQ